MSFNKHCLLFVTICYFVLFRPILLVNVIQNAMLMVINVSCSTIKIIDCLISTVSAIQLIVNLAQTAFFVFTEFDDRNTINYV